MLKTNHGDIDLPAFFPDGTLGVVRGTDALDLEGAGVEGLVICTFHLLVNEIKERISDVGGIHKFMNWKKPIITDSGGFQALSLIHENPRAGRLDFEKGIIFKAENQPRVVFSPEDSIRLQLDLGSDILICLDDCTSSNAPLKEQQASVGRTIYWAKRCKEEFERLTKGLKNKPLLFAVIQGGADKKLRKSCAQELLAFGFDGYCYGGWPVNEKGELLEEILEYTASLMPDDKPKYALGVGKPEDIVKCVEMGYVIFDCVIPTREARHKKLYLFESEKGFNYSTISLQKSIFAKDPNPISEICDCYTCKYYTRSYLYHLFKVGDTLAYRLATIHNLRFYSMLMERLKEPSLKTST